MAINIELTILALCFFFFFFLSASGGWEGRLFHRKFYFCTASMKHALKLFINLDLHHWISFKYMLNCLVLSLDCKEIKWVNPKENQSWLFIGGTDAEAKAPILWWPDAKNWLTGKDPDAGKGGRLEEKGRTEDAHHSFLTCMEMEVRK